MELQTAIAILEYHQEWRLGKREEMIYAPKKLTEALDIVLRAVKNLRLGAVIESLPDSDEIRMEANKKVNKEMKKEYFQKCDRAEKWFYESEHGRGKIAGFVPMLMAEYADFYLESELKKLNKDNN